MKLSSVVFSRGRKRSSFNFSTSGVQSMVIVSCDNVKIKLMEPPIPAGGTILWNKSGRTFTMLLLRKRCRVIIHLRAFRGVCFG